MTTHLLRSRKNNPEPLSLDNGFPEPPLIYAPWAFWFWNGPLLPEAIAGQAADMCGQRLNPGYVHSRFHAEHPTELWLSEDWFRSLEQALQRTREAGMYLTYTTGDPNIPHRMILEKHPELKAESLGWTVREIPGGKATDVPESFFTVAAELDREGRILGETLRVIGEGAAFSWQAPAGHSCRIFIFHKYHGVNPAGAPVNFLDRRFGPAWIGVEHRLYDERVRPFMGSVMPSIFVDHEGSYGYKLAWSDDLAATYRTLHGRDIRSWMPLMVEEDAGGLWGKARRDWFLTVAHLYSQCLMAPVRDWCVARGMDVTCHFWEENLFAQALQVGSLFVAQRAYSVPGTDSLFLDVLKPRDFKETQSVSEFERRQFMSEILGVAGWHLPPALMKRAANCGIAWGLTHFVLHGINSRVHPPRVDYPPDFFQWNPYWKHFHLWTDFIRRAAFVNDHGRLVADVLLLHPIDSVWALLGDGIFDPAKPHDTYPVQRKNLPDARHAPEIGRIEAAYAQAIDDLARQRVEFLIADTGYLEQMTEAPGVLGLRQFEFRTVILPPVVLLPLGIVQKLVHLAQSGGHVYALGELPRGSAEKGMDDAKMKALVDLLRQAPGFHEAFEGLGIMADAPGLSQNVVMETGSFALLSSRRKIGERLFVWLANDTDARQESVLRIAGASGEASIWDCETGERRVVVSDNIAGGCRLALTFEPFEAFWLAVDPTKPPLGAGPADAIFQPVLPLDQPWSVCIPSDGQPLPFGERGEVPPFSGERPLESWLRWGLRTFTGFVEYSRELNLPSVTGSEVLDLGEVRHMAEVFVNGSPAGERLWAPFHFPIGHLLRPGPNTLRIRVGNLVLNTIAADKNYDWKWHKPPADADLDAGLFGPVRLFHPQPQSGHKF